MACVYKLTRADGLEYIGISKNLKRRLWAHRRSRRFAEHKIVTCTILFEGSYEECDRLEEKFIEEHGTFRHGLNMTNRGKGKNLTDKFNTLGYKFSDESRKKMSEKSKARVRKKGYRFSDETKAAWSELRKGKVWGPVKIDAQQLIEDWKAFNPTLVEMEPMLSPKVVNGERYFKNGRAFNYNKGKLSLFKDIKSKEHNVTPQAIKRIIIDEQLL